MPRWVSVALTWPLPGAARPVAQERNTTIRCLPTGFPAARQPAATAQPSPRPRKHELPSAGG